MNEPPIHKACGEPILEVEVQRSDDTIYRWDAETQHFIELPGSGKSVEIVCQSCYTELDEEERDAFYRRRKP